MDNIDEKLTQILSSPDSMSKIMSIVSSLSGNESSTPTPTPVIESTPSILPNIDPKIMTLATRLLSEYSKEDPIFKVLEDLKPFVSNEKHASIDKAIQVSRFCRVAKLILNDLKLPKL